MRWYVVAAASYHLWFLTTNATPRFRLIAMSFSLLFSIVLQVGGVAIAVVHTLSCSYISIAHHAYSAYSLSALPDSHKNLSSFKICNTYINLTLDITFHYIKQSCHLR